MPNIPRIPPLLRRLAPTLGRMAATFLLSAAQLGQAYAPCALACVALAGPGSGGFLCLLGAAAGALVFFPFQPGLRFLAAAILIYAANTAFFDTRFYLHPGFARSSASPPQRWCSWFGWWSGNCPRSFFSSPRWQHSGQPVISLRPSSAGKNTPTAERCWACACAPLSMVSGQAAAFLWGGHC